jgi:hypothetical protein
MDAKAHHVSFALEARGMGWEIRVGRRRKKVEKLKGARALSPLQVTPEALGSRRQ